MGAKYGESVSIIIDSRGIVLATLRTSSAFLNVSIPENEIKNPSSIDASANGRVCGKGDHGASNHTDKVKGKGKY